MSIDTPLHNAPSSFAFALGGLAGNNAHGAGLLQAALDERKYPAMISCTSGQIYWVYQYLMARKGESANLKQVLGEEIKLSAPSGNPNIDMMLLAFLGRRDVFRLSLFREFPVDLFKNSLTASINVLRGWWKVFYLKELLKTIPARTMVPLFKDYFFREVSKEFNDSDTAIVFNSFDPNQGIEFVHLNDAAKKLLGGKGPGDKSSYRDRTLYKDITPQYIRDGLWIYQYGFENRSNMVDGAYYRQVMLSELAKAKVQQIFIARPINKKWIGDLPKTWVELEDMKTETNFNGSYQGERDKILLINKLVKEQKLADGYQEIDLIELEIETQESFFDYIFEDMTVFDRARERGSAKLREALTELVAEKKETKRETAAVR